MDLEQQVEAAFAPGGVLSRTTDHFMPRRGQTDMAMAVARAIEGAYPLVVEASTGVGKTFSYLVPALLSGERVMLSTATKALQDQLFGRDLPTQRRNSRAARSVCAARVCQSTKPRACCKPTPNMSRQKSSNCPVVMFLPRN